MGDAKQTRRILAIAMGPDWHSRLAAQAGGMERQTPRDWVTRDNADRLTGEPAGPALAASRASPRPSDARRLSG